MSLHTAKIVHTYKEYLAFAVLLLSLSAISLSYSYEHYLTFKQFSTYKTKALILKQELRHTKENRPYFYVQARTEHFDFSTTSFAPLRTLVGHRVDMTLFTKDIDFFSYATHFYAQSYFDALYVNKDRRFKLIDAVHAQHEDAMIANLYGALFLLEPIENNLRNILSALGVNHLAALSGFHLGFLLAILFFILKPFYTYFQARYFSYRHYYKDLMLIGIGVLFIYIHFLGYSPSLIRAFGMIVVGFFLYDRGIKLISFEMLSITALLLLALQPTLVVSIAFWFSMLGVFFIFLFLHYFSHLHAATIVIVLNILLTILMTPFTLYFFEAISIYQLLSPILTVLFSIFYPLSMALHFIGMGDLLNEALLWLFALPSSASTVALSPALMTAYGVTLIGAVVHRYLFYLSIGVAGFITFIYYIELL